MIQCNGARAFTRTCLLTRGKLSWRMLYRGRSSIQCVTRLYLSLLQLTRAVFLGRDGMQFHVDCLYGVRVGWDDPVGGSMESGRVFHNLAVLWCGQDYSCFLFVFVFCKMCFDLVLKFDFLMFFFTFKERYNELLVPLVSVSDYLIKVNMILTEKINK